MSAVWTTAPLGKLLTKSDHWIVLDAEREYKEVTVRLWGRGVALRGIVSGPAVAGTRRMQVRAGEFIASRIDARNGAFGLIPDELDGAVVTNDFPVFTLDEQRVLPGFLNWLSKTHDFAEACKAASEGTTNRVRLKEDRFLRIEIPLPPLAEQRRIVAKIARLAEKIEEARGLRKTSTRLLSRFVTSQHLQLSSETHVALGEFLALDEDRVLVTPGVSYPQVGVKAYGQGLFPKPAVAANDTTYTTFNRLYSGAVLLSQVKGWEGAIAVCGDQLSGLFVSPEYRTFRCIPSAADARYLRHVFATDWFWLQLKNLTRGLGGRRERIRPEQFLELTIPMPPVEQQTKSAELFDKLEPVRHIQGQTVAELDALLPAILDRAFKGEL